MRLMRSLMITPKKEKHKTYQEATLGKSIKSLELVTALNRLQTGYHGYHLVGVVPGDAA